MLGALGSYRSQAWTRRCSFHPEFYDSAVESFPELPGANTQGATIEEARSNLKEAVELVLEANRLLSEESLKGKRVIREPFSISA